MHLLTITGEPVHEPGAQMPHNCGKPVTTAADSSERLFSNMGFSSLEVLLERQDAKRQ